MRFARFAREQQNFHEISTKFTKKTLLDQKIFSWMALDSWKMWKKSLTKINNHTVSYNCNYTYFYDFSAGSCISGTIKVVLKSEEVFADVLTEYFISPAIQSIKVGGKMLLK